METVRPTGVKLIIAFALFGIVYRIGFTPSLIQAGNWYVIILLSLPFSFLGIIEIVGLWRMRRWGLWLAIVLSVVGLAFAFYLLAELFNYLLYPRGGLDLTPFTLALVLLNGPIVIIISCLIINYLYKRRTMFR